MTYEISIHALLAESDSFSSSYGSAPALFLSTLSLRRATLDCEKLLHPTKLFLSTLSLRRATIERPIYGTPKAISIHALLAESDRYQNCE